MRKFLASIAVGFLLSIGSVSVFAKCADVITFGDQICALTSSGTTSTGVEVCRYSCTTIKSGGEEEELAQ
jgi:hypothetical protein